MTTKAELKAILAAMDNDDEVIETHEAAGVPAAHVVTSEPESDEDSMEIIAAIHEAEEAQEEIALILGHDVNVTVLLSTPDGGIITVIGNNANTKKSDICALFREAILFTEELDLDPVDFQA